MNLQDFKTQSRQLMNAPFISPGGNPIQLLLQRSEFEEKKLRQLIALAEGSPYQTVIRQGRGWERKLTNLLAKRARIKAAYNDTASP